MAPMCSKSLQYPVWDNPWPPYVSSTYRPSILAQLTPGSLGQFSGRFDGDRVVGIVGPGVERLGEVLHSCPFVRIDAGIGEDHVFVDLPEEEAPGEGCRSVLAHRASPVLKPSPERAAAASAGAGRKRGP